MKVRFQKPFIFRTVFNDFINFWSEVGAALESPWDNFWHMKATLGALWLHFGVALEPLWAYRRRMAGMMCVVAGLMASWSAPNGSINRKYTFYRWILLVQEGPEDAKRTNNGAARTVWEGVGGG